ncbi:hypothetical protein, partial [Azospirillum griseum]
PILYPQPSSIASLPICAPMSAGLALDHAVRCGYGGRVIRCDWHLSFSRINSSISIDITGRPILKGQSDATLKRIEVVAKDILTKFAA